MSNAPLKSELPAVQDTFGRPLRSLRLSVTDRCNLRCNYCMPEEEYAWLPRETLDRKSTRLNSSHIQKSRMPSSA